MIHHCLRIDFKPGLSEEELDAAKAKLRSLEDMDSVENVSLGQVLDDEIGERHGGASCVLIVSITDAEAYRRYMHDPIHKEVIEFLNAGRKDRAATLVDYSDDWDPELPGRLRQIRDEPGSLARVPQPADEHATLPAG